MAIAEKQEQTVYQEPSGHSKIDLVLSRIGRLAPAGYAVALHVRMATPYVVYRDYPEEWIDIYSRKGYALCDPTVAWAMGNRGQIRWSELQERGYADCNGVMEEAKAFGLKFGVSVSTGKPEARSFGSFAREDREFTHTEMMTFATLLDELHSLTKPPQSLTKAQNEALTLIGEGCRHTEAAARLGISESALKLRLASARERLQARTTAEAIQRAKEFRLI